MGIVGLWVMLVELKSIESPRSPEVRRFRHGTSAQGTARKKPRLCNAAHIVREFEWEFNDLSAALSIKQSQWQT